jgi:hypothetical protein
MTDAAQDFVSLSDMPLLRSLAAAKRRPNLLIMCDGALPDAVIDPLQELCAPPFHRIALPGPLDLPAFGPGTLLLDDVSGLTLAQQGVLHDWLNDGRNGLQIVSVTKGPARSFVPNEHFLASLFYRLNIIRVIATTART